MVNHGFPISWGESLENRPVAWAELEISPECSDCLIFEEELLIRYSLLVDKLALYFLAVYI